MIAHFERTPLGIGKGARLRFFTSPLVFNVHYLAPKAEDTPENWQRFFDEQLERARAYLRTATAVL